jgi:hypothetical protein
MDYIPHFPCGAVPVRPKYSSGLVRIIKVNFWPGMD